MATEWYFFLIIFFSNYFTSFFVILAVIVEKNESIEYLYLSYVASFAGLSILPAPSIFSNVYFRLNEN